MEIISIIVPVYNAEKSLVRCLNSIKNQTYQNIEVIVVDDGSLDNSLSIANEFAKTDDRFKIIAAEHKGQGFARNIGLDIVQGAYIGFVDADDTIDEKMYEIMHDRLIKSNSDIAQCNILNVFHSGQSRVQIPEVDGKVEITNKAMYFGKYVFKNTHSYECCNKLIRREIIDGIRFKDNKEIFAEDLLFNLEIAIKIKSIVYISTPLYHYFQNSNSHSKTNNREKIFKLCNLFKLFLNEVSDHSLSIEVKKLAVLIIMINLSHIIRTPEGIQTAKEILVRDDIREYILSYSKSSCKFHQKIIMFGILYLPMSLRISLIEAYYLNMK